MSLKTCKIKAKGIPVIFFKKQLVFFVQAHLDAGTNVIALLDLNLSRNVVLDCRAFTYLDRPTDLIKLLT